MSCISGMNWNVELNVVSSLLIFSRLIVAVFSPLQFYFFFFFFLFVVNFVIHWNETAMGLHVFPIPVPPPTSLSTRSP